MVIISIIILKDFVEQIFVFFSSSIDIKIYRIFVLCFWNQDIFRIRAAIQFLFYKSFLIYKRYEIPFSHLLYDSFYEVGSTTFFKWQTQITIIQHSIVCMISTSTHISFYVCMSYIQRLFLSFSAWNVNLSAGCEYAEICVYLSTSSNNIYASALEYYVYIPSYW